ncbi:hypothetical protein [Paraburkholderia solisilvae]|uniref:hypothetical protein n=1 Tax=Paraburkholderia solisilvae TaxID=624376 RepID=UPI0015827CF6|nr:hypothetical protein [Paraburkholderia solisilvae]
MDIEAMTAAMTSARPELRDSAIDVSGDFRLRGAAMRSDFAWLQEPHSASAT